MTVITLKTERQTDGLTTLMLENFIMDIGMNFHIGLPVCQCWHPPWPFQWQQLGRCCRTVNWIKMGLMPFHISEGTTGNKRGPIDSWFPASVANEEPNDFKWARKQLSCTHRKPFNGGRPEVMAASHELTTQPCSNMYPHVGLLLCLTSVLLALYRP